MSPQNAEEPRVCVVPEGKLVRWSKALSLEHQGRTLLTSPLRPCISSLQVDTSAWCQSAVPLVLKGFAFTFPPPGEGTPVPISQIMSQGSESSEPEDDEQRPLWSIFVTVQAAETSLFLPSLLIILCCSLFVQSVWGQEKCWKQEMTVKCCNWRSRCYFSYVAFRISIF